MQPAPSAWPHNYILAGKLYKAVKSAKALIAYKSELIANVTQSGRKST